MGAPIIIDESLDLWVSNGAKDLFCDIVVTVAKLVGIDISEVYETAPGIAGTYGISGVGIDTEEFYPYFGGREGFRLHLDICSARIDEACDLDVQGRDCMIHILAWAKYMMDGGVLGEAQDIYNTWPPSSYLHSPQP